MHAEEEGKMSIVDVPLYANIDYSVFPCSFSPPEEMEMNPPDSPLSPSNSPASTEEADDEAISATLPLLILREQASTTSSRRSTPRSIPSSRVHSPRTKPSSFDVIHYFHAYRLQCVDITEDVRSVAIASAKLHCLYNFMPDYFSLAPDGLLLNELRQEYDLFLSSVTPLPSTAIRIGQLTEQLKMMLR